MRLPRARIENCCIHVTHRCHGRDFLLDMDSFRRWHEAAIADQCRLASAKISREPHWSGAFVVGSRNWLEGIVGGVSQAADYITPAQTTPNTDADGTCVLKPPQSLSRRIWEKLAGGK